LNSNSNKIYDFLKESLNADEFEILMSINKKLKKPLDLSNIEIIDKHIVMLNLIDQALTIFPESICILSFLERLYINRNMITYIPDCIGDLKRLKYFHSKYNQIITLPDRFGELHNLERLDLKNNMITHLPDTIFDHMKKLKMLNLGENPKKRNPKSLQKVLEDPNVEFDDYPSRREIIEISDEFKANNNVLEDEIASNLGYTKNDLLDVIRTQKNRCKIVEDLLEFAGNKAQLPSWLITSAIYLHYHLIEYNKYLNLSGGNRLAISAALLTRITRIQKDRGMMSARDKPLREIAKFFYINMQTVQKYHQEMFHIFPKDIWEDFSKVLPNLKDIGKIKDIILLTEKGFSLPTPTFKIFKQDPDMIGLLMKTMIDFGKETMNEEKMTSIRFAGKDIVIEQGTVIMAGVVVEWTTRAVKEKEEKNLCEILKELIDKVEDIYKNEITSSIIRVNDFLGIKTLITTHLLSNRIAPIHLQKFGDVKEYLEFPEIKIFGLTHQGIERYNSDKLKPVLHKLFDDIQEEEFSKMINKMHKYNIMVSFQDSLMRFKNADGKKLFELYKFLVKEGIFNANHVDQFE